MEIPQWNTETQANNNTWLTKGPVSYCISLSTQTGKETPENINVTGWFHMQPLKITSLQTLGSFQFSSFAQLCRPHGLQHTWLPCSSPTPRVYSNPCPLSQFRSWSKMIDVLMRRGCTDTTEERKLKTQGMADNALNRGLREPVLLTTWLGPLSL